MDANSEDHIVCQHSYVNLVTTCEQAITGTLTWDESLTRALGWIIVNQALCPTSE